MKVELADERIAEWVYKNAPIEDKAHALAEQFVQERYRHYCSAKKLLLSRHELAFIRPHLPALDLTNEQTVFVLKSQEEAKREQRQQQLKNMSIVVLCVGFFFSLWGLWERKRYTNASNNLALAQDSIGKVWQEVYRERSVQRTDPPPMAAAAAITNFRSILLQGRVTTAQGQPIANATLHLVGTQVQTNAKGAYQLQLVYPPQALDTRINLTIERDDYQSLIHSVSLSRDTVNTNITLLPQ